LVLFAAYLQTTKRAKTTTVPPTTSQPTTTGRIIEVFVYIVVSVADYINDAVLAYRPTQEHCNGIDQAVT